MARIPRILITGAPTAYHVMSRTALPGYPIGDVEKDYFVHQMKILSRLYFTEVLGFCCMGNHFHLLVRMLPDTKFSDDELKKRLASFYNKDATLFGEGQLPFYRKKLGNLSEYVREIKLRFTRFYNKRHNRKGYFWGDRFKSVVVENGDTLINCLAYIDLNPVRAGLVNRPEDYRWNSIGYHIQSGNKDNFLSLKYGFLKNRGKRNKDRLKHYRRFLYNTGAMDKEKCNKLDAAVLSQEQKNDFQLSRLRRFKYRTRYFTDSGIIGGKAFVTDTYGKVGQVFKAKKKKIPKLISGLTGIYSLKRLTE